jgi:hypothetical protein
MDDELEQQQDAADTDEEAPVPGALPEPSGVEIDPRERVKKYLQMQIEGRDRHMGPEYTRASAENQNRMEQAKDNASLAALLMNSAAKFGTIAGKTPDTSAMDSYAKQVGQNLSDYQQRGMQMDQQQEMDRDKQTKLYQYLSDLQRQQQAEKVAQYNAETKRKISEMPDWQPLSAEDSEGYPMERNKKTGETRRIPGAARKNPNVSLQETQRTDEEGNPLLFNPKTGSYQRAEAGVKPKPGKNTSPYDNLPKDQQILVSDLQRSNASKLTITNQLEAELSNFKNFVEKGNSDQAVTAGENMLKVLNSTEGKDAVGAEEAKRLAGFLKFNLLNLSNPGPTFGRDLNAFYTQASSKTNSIKDAIKGNQKTIDSIFAGSYNPANIQATPTEIGPSTAGTAGAAPGKQVAKKQYSASRNKTKLIYTDGSEEIVDGKQ